MFKVSKSTVSEFLLNGYVLQDSPLKRSEIQEIQEYYPTADEKYRQGKWPKDAHPLAMRFALMGERTFVLAERAEFVNAAKLLLDAESVHVGCCGVGNAIEMVCGDGRPRKEIHWHSTPGSDLISENGVRQVAFRFAIDVHDGTSGRLKILPGTHRRSKSEIQIKIERELTDDKQRLVWNSQYFGNHREQVELSLDDTKMLMWTPDVWHATGEMKTRKHRRALSWIYFPRGGRFRDRNSILDAFPEVVASWTPQRKALWGME